MIWKLPACRTCAACGITRRRARLICFLVVSIKQRYPGHARQAGLIATECHAAAYLGRYTVVVDDDIDPTNLNEVLWAVCTRSDPSTGYRDSAPLLERSAGSDHSQGQKGLQLARDHRRYTALRVEGHISRRCRDRAKSCASRFWENGRTNCLSREMQLEDRIWSDRRIEI